MTSTVDSFNQEVQTVVAPRYHAVRDILLDCATGQRLQLGSTLDTEKVIRVLAELLNRDMINLDDVDFGAF